MTDLLPEAAAALARTFAADEADDERAEALVRAGLTLEDVRAFLRERIGVLLDHSPSLLMSLLYRIDVAEADVKRVLGQAAPARIADDLAELVLQRQLQKLRIRRAYRSREDGD